MKTFVVCFDCKTVITDFVKEVRQVSGGDGVTYAGDFQRMYVHANRKDCLAAQEAKRIERLRAKDPFYDVPAC